MFNLLVKHSPWADGRDTLPTSRAFEYTEPALVEQFKPGNQLDFAALAGLPTLFLEETSGQRNQFARVGTITRARIAGQNVALEYTYDLSVPAIPNRVLQSFATDLDIQEFQFSRTHCLLRQISPLAWRIRNAGPHLSAYVRFFWR